MPAPAGPGAASSAQGQDSKGGPGAVEGSARKGPRQQALSASVKRLPALEILSRLRLKGKFPYNPGQFNAILGYNVRRKLDSVLSVAEEKAEDRAGSLYTPVVTFLTRLAQVGEAEAHKLLKRWAKAHTRRFTDVKARLEAASDPDTIDEVFVRRTVVDIAAFAFAEDRATLGIMVEVYKIANAKSHPCKAVCSRFVNEEEKNHLCDKIAQKFAWLTSHGSRSQAPNLAIFGENKHKWADHRVALQSGLLEILLILSYHREQPRGTVLRFLDIFAESQFGLDQPCYMYLSSDIRDAKVSTGAPGSGRGLAMRVQALAVFCVLVMMELHKFRATTQDPASGPRAHPLNNLETLTAFSDRLLRAARNPRTAHEAITPLLLAVKTAAVVCNQLGRGNVLLEKGYFFMQRFGPLGMLLRNLKRIVGASSSNKDGIGSYARSATISFLRTLFRSTLYGDTVSPSNPEMRRNGDDRAVIDLFITSYENRPEECQNFFQVLSHHKWNIHRSHLCPMLSMSQFPYARSRMLELLTCLSGRSAGAGSDLDAPLGSTAGARRIQDLRGMIYKYLQNLRFVTEHPPPGSFKVLTPVDAECMIISMLRAWRPTKHAPGLTIPAGCVARVLRGPDGTLSPIVAWSSDARATPRGYLKTTPLDYLLLRLDQLVWTGNLTARLSCAVGGAALHHGTSVAAEWAELAILVRFIATLAQNEALTGSDTHSSIVRRLFESRPGMRRPAVDTVIRLLMAITAYTRVAPSSEKDPVSTAQTLTSTLGSLSTLLYCIATAGPGTGGAADSTHVSDVFIVRFHRILTEGGTGLDQLIRCLAPQSKAGPAAFAGLRMVIWLFQRTCIHEWRYAHTTRGALAAALASIGRTMPRALSVICEVLKAHDTWKYTIPREKLLLGALIYKVFFSILDGPDLSAPLRTDHSTEWRAAAPQLRGNSMRWYLQNQFRTQLALRSALVKPIVFGVRRLERLQSRNAVESDFEILEALVDRSFAVLLRVLRLEREARPGSCGVLAKAFMESSFRWHGDEYHSLVPSLVAYLDPGRRSRRLAKRALEMLRILVECSGLPTTPTTTQGRRGNTSGQIGLGNDSISLVGFLGTRMPQLQDGINRALDERTEKGTLCSAALGFVSAAFRFEPGLAERLVNIRVGSAAGDAKASGGSSAPSGGVFDSGVVKPLIGIIKRQAKVVGNERVSDVLVNALEVLTGLWSSAIYLRSRASDFDAAAPDDESNGPQHISKAIAQDIGPDLWSAFGRWAGGKSQLDFSRNSPKRLRAARAILEILTLELHHIKAPKTFRGDQTPGPASGNERTVDLIRVSLKSVLSHFDFFSRVFQGSRAAAFKKLARQLHIRPDALLESAPYDSNCKKWKIKWALATLPATDAATVEDLRKLARQANEEQTLTSASLGALRAWRLGVETGMRFQRLFEAKASAPLDAVGPADPPGIAALRNASGLLGKVLRVNNSECARLASRELIRIVGILIRGLCPVPPTPGLSLISGANQHLSYRALLGKTMPLTTALGLLDRLVDDSKALYENELRYSLTDARLATGQSTDMMDAVATDSTGFESEPKIQNGMRGLQITHPEMRASMESSMKGVADMNDTAPQSNDDGDIKGGKADSQQTDPVVESARALLVPILVLLRWVRGCLCRENHSNPSLVDRNKASDSLAKAVTIICPLACRGLRQNILEPVSLSILTQLATPIEGYLGAATPGTSVKTSRSITSQYVRCLVRHDAIGRLLRRFAEARDVDVALSTIRLFIELARSREGALELIARDVVLFLCNHQVFSRGVPGAGGSDSALTAYLESGERNGWHEVWCACIILMSILTRIVGRGAGPRAQGFIRQIAQFFTVYRAQITSAMLSISVPHPRPQSGWRAGATAAQIRNRAAADWAALVQNFMAGRLSFRYLFRLDSPLVSDSHNRVSFTLGQAEEAECVLRLMYEFGYLQALWHLESNGMARDLRVCALLVLNRTAHILRKKNLGPTVIPMSQNEEDSAMRRMNGRGMQPTKTGSGAPATPASPKYLLLSPGPRSRSRIAEAESAGSDMHGRVPAEDTFDQRAKQSLLFSLRNAVMYLHQLSAGPIRGSGGLGGGGLLFGPLLRDPGNAGALPRSSADAPDYLALPVHLHVLESVIKDICVRGIERSTDLGRRHSHSPQQYNDHRLSFENANRLTLEVSASLLLRQLNLYVELFTAQLTGASAGGGSGSTRSPYGLQSSVYRSRGRRSGAERTHKYIRDHIKNMKVAALLSRLRQFCTRDNRAGGQKNTFLEQVLQKIQHVQQRLLTLEDKSNTRLDGRTRRMDVMEVRPRSRVNTPVRTPSTAHRMARDAGSSARAVRGSEMRPGRGYSGDVY